MTKEKSKGKARTSACNVGSASSKETEEGDASLTDSEKEESAFVADQDAHPMSRTRSG